MFLENSRYYNLKTIVVKTPEGLQVKAVTLRRLPSFGAADVQPAIVKEGDRLDLMAFRKYNDPTRFWHIADANTELQAGDLTKQANRTIEVPEK